ncbi:RNA polymerase sigma factor [bacterium]|nr:RNA polymerase sigma factor [bacterium]
MEREESIIQSIQKGEYDQFEKLYHYYFSHIFSFIFVKTNGNKSLTDDICSEVFLKAFEKIKDFTYQNGNFRAWLFTIAYHTFLDFIKDQTSYSLQDWEVIDDNNFCDFFEKKERAKDILLFLESL